MAELSKTKDDTLPGPGGRREFLIGANLAMAGGLAASYGTFGVYAMRYLYPNGAQEKVWMFVTQLSRFDRGDSIWTVRVGRAPSVTRVTTSPPDALDNRKTAASATWVPTIRKRRSTRSRSTASPIGI